MSDEDRRRFLDQLKDAADKDGIRLSGMIQQAVENHYGGISGAAVTKQRRRLAELRSKDRKLVGQLAAS